ncbi:MAG TPA: hypothetical protein VFA18_02175 [Gemmataceae bacterium]|nr:hypothetical protein [Gemmataceae bacterium]
MSNRILKITVHNHSVAPAAAEVWITVTPEFRTPTTEVRGRLMGPRCPYASTVEVAYPLRPLPPSYTEPLASPGLTRRVVIPEASLWEPESPFLYEGPVELWQDGQRCDRRMVRHGLRTITLGPRGVLVNGRPLWLRGRDAESWSEEQIGSLRAAGDNLLVGPVAPEAAAWWDAADRFGLLVLGRIHQADPMTEKLIAEGIRHPSCLGWILEGHAWRQAGPSLLSWLLDRAGESKVGAELDQPPEDTLRPGIHFLICSNVQTAQFATSGIPCLLATGDSEPSFGETIIGVVNKRL